MYLIRADFPEVVAFVLGCDLGSAGLLTGFREWLMTRAGGGSNWTWWALVLRLVDPVNDPSPRDLTPEMDEQAVAMLFDCLDDFLRLREEKDGLRRIYAAYEAWLAAPSGEDKQASAQSWPRPRDTVRYDPTARSGPA